jgi:hypothetical protein
MVDPGSSSSEEISLATLEAHELFRGEDAAVTNAGSPISPTSTPR